MKQKITPFLWFDRNCEEAVNFYVNVFANNPAGSTGENKIVGIKRYPEGITEGPMKGFDGQVLTAVFLLNGQQFMALDGGPIFKFSESVSFLVECKDQAEIDYFWNAFTTNGGAESQCGWCKDRFGFSWQIQPDMGRFFNTTDTEASNRAMQAMLTMKKMDIAKLEAAYEGK